MTKETLTQFLDTGWYTEATLFYNGYIYWFEGCTDFDTDITKFFVARWKAKNEKNKIFFTYCDKKLEPLDYKILYEENNKDLDLIKKHFLTEKMFDGKSFWEVEGELLWLDDSGENIVLEK